MDRVSQSGGCAPTAVYISQGVRVCAAIAAGRGPHGAPAAASAVRRAALLVGRGLGQPRGRPQAHLLQPIPQHAAHQGERPLLAPGICDFAGLSALVAFWIACTASSKVFGVPAAEHWV